MAATWSEEGIDLPEFVVVNCFYSYNMYQLHIHVNNISKICDAVIENYSTFGSLETEGQINEILVPALQQPCSKR